MKSKIKSLAIICQQGTKIYEVGRYYNSLMLNRIEDKSMEFPDSMEFIHMGFTEDGATVFETINAPIEVV